jgi:HAD superfamily hydrolase (TIGR01484 family)
MKKKLIAFDQDDTLNVTKQPVPPEMAELLTKLTEKFEICVISGTNFEVMKLNEPDRMVELGGATDKNLEKVHIMSNTGTQYWHFAKGEWKREYAHFLSDEQIKKISESLEKAARKLDYWVEGIEDIVENRGSQITYSALGQWADPKDKYAWDPDLKKRKAIVKLIEPELKNTNVEIKIGGTTSIDVTLPGIDKAYAMRELMKATGFKQDEILFIGDKLQPGGNDYAVKEMGIDAIEVRDWKETANILRGILAIV